MSKFLAQDKHISSVKTPPGSKGGRTAVIWNSQSFSRADDEFVHENMHTRNAHLWKEHPNSKQSFAESGCWVFQGVYVNATQGDNW